MCAFTGPPCGLASSLRVCQACSGFFQSPLQPGKPKQAEARGPSFCPWRFVVL